MTAEWWRHAVIYQIYPKSFADASGDGVGDLHGVVARLDHLARLGVDAIWLSPFYRGPQRDGGYDVADHRDVDPRFGTVADAERLVEEAHRRGIRVIVDVVPNHTSSDHPFFREAMASPPGSPAWGRYHCVRGRGPDGDEPPNDWRSLFGGIAWTRIPDADGARPAGGTCTSSTRTSPTSTGRIPTSSPSSTRRCGTGSTAGSTASASTSRTAS